VIFFGCARTAGEAALLRRTAGLSWTTLVTFARRRSRSAYPGQSRSRGRRTEAVAVAGTDSGRASVGIK
jgi:hypothetical protein